MASASFRWRYVCCDMQIRATVIENQDIEIKPEAIKDSCPSKYTEGTTEFCKCDNSSDRNISKISV